MKRKIGAVVALLIAGFILAGGVSALGAKGPGANGIRSFSVSDDVRSQMDAALTNDDYDSFVEIQSNNFPNAPTLSKERFELMVARHTTQQKIDAAIEAGNYAEWKTLVENSTDPFSQRMLETITAENFPLLKDWKDTQDKLHTLEGQLGFSPKNGRMSFGRMMEHAQQVPRMGAHATPSDRG